MGSNTTKTGQGYAGILVPDNTLRYDPENSFGVSLGGGVTGPARRQRKSYLVGRGAFTVQPGGVPREDRDIVITTSAGGGSVLGGAAHIWRYEDDPTSYAYTQPHTQMQYVPVYPGDDLVVLQNERRNPRSVYHKRTDTIFTAHDFTFGLKGQAQIDSISVTRSDDAGAIIGSTTIVYSSNDLAHAPDFNDFDVFKHHPNIFLVDSDQRVEIFFLHYSIESELTLDNGKLGIGRVYADIPNGLDEPLEDVWVSYSTIDLTNVVGDGDIVRDFAVAKNGYEVLAFVSFWDDALGQEGVIHYASRDGGNQFFRVGVYRDATIPNVIRYRDEYIVSVAIRDTSTGPTTSPVNKRGTIKVADPFEAIFSTDLNGSLAFAPGFREILPLGTIDEVYSSVVIDSEDGVLWYYASENFPGQRSVFWSADGGEFWAKFGMVTHVDVGNVAWTKVKPFKWSGDIGMAFQPFIGGVPALRMGLHRMGGWINAQPRSDFGVETDYIHYVRSSLIGSTSYKYDGFSIPETYGYTVFLAAGAPLVDNNAGALFLNPILASNARVYEGTPGVYPVANYDNFHMSRVKVGSDTGSDPLLNGQGYTVRIQDSAASIPSSANIDVTYTGSDLYITIAGAGPIDVKVPLDDIVAGDTIDLIVALGMDVDVPKYNVAVYYRKYQDATDGPVQQNAKQFKLAFEAQDQDSLQAAATPFYRWGLAPTGADPTTSTVTIYSAQWGRIPSDERLSNGFVREQDLIGKWWSGAPISLANSGMFTSGSGMATKCEVYTIDPRFTLGPDYALPALSPSPQIGLRSAPAESPMELAYISQNTELKCTGSGLYGIYLENFNFPFVEIETFDGTVWNSHGVIDLTTYIVFDQYGDTICPTALGTNNQGHQQIHRNEFSGGYFYGLSEDDGVTTITPPYRITRNTEGLLNWGNSIAENRPTFWLDAPISEATITGADPNVTTNIGAFNGYLLPPKALILFHQNETMGGIRLRVTTAPAPFDYLGTRLEPYWKAGVISMGPVYLMGEHFDNTRARVLDLGGQIITRPDGTRYLDTTVANRRRVELSWSRETSSVGDIDFLDRDFIGSIDPASGIATPISHDSGSAFTFTGMLDEVGHSPIVYIPSVEQSAGVGDLLGAYKMHCAQGSVYGRFIPDSYRMETVLGGPHEGCEVIRSSVITIEEEL